MGRYKNYRSNLDVLRRAPEQDLANEFIASGINRIFVMQFELSWRLLREVLEYEGRLEGATGSPRGIIKAAYSTYDFIDEATWLAMLESRNATEHVYDANMAERLVSDINGKYIAVFENLLSDLKKTYPSDILETF